MTAQEVTLTASMPRAMVLPNRATRLISRSNPEDANQHIRRRGCHVEYVEGKVKTTCDFSAVVLRICLQAY